MTTIGFIHVPKTAGFSVRVSIRDINSVRVKYLGHRPNCEEFERDYVTVSTLRHPYDIFLSGYRFHRSLYVDNLPGYSIQDHINKTITNGYKGYISKWFKYKQPKHLLRFESVQQDWFHLLHTYNISHDSQFPHLHNTHSDQSLQATPTTHEHEQIHEMIADDLSYYDQVTVQLCTQKKAQ